MEPGRTIVSLMAFSRDEKRAEEGAAYASKLALALQSACVDSERAAPWRISTRPQSVQIGVTRTALGRLAEGFFHFANAQ
jgi:hypothetical protein